ncbi:MAG: hypothetical protein QOD03_1177 [Verrucomicrobiota bacterium]|jgi:hypothetical protein
MPKALRYTGDWPPPDILRDYPNWVFANDEEGEEGQDETTVKPESQQAFISRETQITAGSLLLADERTLSAIICIESSLPVGVSAFEGRWSWSVWRNHRTTLWRPATQDYLPESQRLPSVSLYDSRVFPLRFSTSLPREPRGKSWRIEILPDGTSREWI